MVQRALLAMLLAASLAMPALAQPPSAAAAPASPEARRAALAAIDTDGDGRLSRTEWLAAGRRERGFAMADGNGDGFIDAAERQALVERLRARRAARAAGNQGER